MKLQTKILLLMVFAFLLSFSIFEYFDYQNIKIESTNNMRKEAKHIRGVLMATRRVYHQQFLASGIPLTVKTLGFLPAHSLSQISKDFKNWTDDKLQFNNVSDRPRNQRNTADSIEKEAISYFRENPTEKERFVSFKSTEGDGFYHYSAPIWIEEYCLKCHGKREDAPVAIRNSYETSYDYKIGDLRGVMSIKLPATQLNKLVWSNFLHNLWMHLASFTGIFFMIAFLLYRYVTIPLSRITEGLSSVGENLPYQKIEGLSGEMAVVGNTFNQMSERLIKRESLLKESEERLMAIIDNTTAIIYLKDINGKYILVNRQYENLFNLSNKDIIGKTDKDIFPEDMADILVMNDKSVLDSKSSLTIEETMPYGGELHSYISLKFPLLDRDKAVYGICGISTDITDKKKAEEVLIRSEKLRAMGMITAGIAHDFNNILAVISGCTEVIGQGNKDNKELMSMLSTIMKASDDGAGIVRKMSLFTNKRDDALEHSSVDIVAVVKHAIEFSKPRWMNIAKAGGVEYKIDVDEIIEVPKIMGAESELREVLVNLINNAMDAMPEGGCLSFRTWQNESNIFVGISDTGEGMSDEVKQRVFEPFYTTKREKGSGLGLSMSYSIIEKHEGEINIKSKEKEGTTFTIRLPIAVSSTLETKSHVAGHAIKKKGLSVLVVDDKEDMRSLLKLFFSKNGHNVKTVESGEMALDVLNKESFDIVLCDLVMPGMSGYAVVEELNMFEKKPKIGVMTGWSKEIDDENESNLNVDFIIKKPFKFPVLSEYIYKAFSAD